MSHLNRTEVVMATENLLAAAIANYCTQHCTPLEHRKVELCLGQNRSEQMKRLMLLALQEVHEAAELQARQIVETIVLP